MPVSGWNFNWENYCDPDNGEPVLVKIDYLNDGSILRANGFHVDGAKYTKALSDLVICNQQIIVNSVGALSAGASSKALGTIVFSNSNSVSFGLSGNTITASVPAPKVFLSSNGISFGTAGNNVTASYTVPSLAAGSISAGTTNATLGQAVFSNSNGVSFGANGQTITASINALTSQSNQALSAANGSFTFQTAKFADSNGVSFSTGTQGIFATVKTDYLTSQTVEPAIQSISAGTTRATTGEVVFSNSNGLSFGMDAGTITGSYSVPSTAGLISAINVSAGSTSNNLSKVTFDNSNGVSFGLNGSVITATVATNYLTSQSNQALSAANGSFTFQTASFTDSNGVSFSTGTQGIYATVKTDYLTSQSNQAFSAQGGSSAFQTLVFTNSNGFSFSNTAGSVWGSYTVPTVTNSSWTVSDAATSGTVAQLAFTNLNGVTLSLSSGTGGSHTIVGSHNALTSQSAQVASAANGSFNFQTLSFSNLNGVSFGTSAGSAITASYTVPTVTNSSWTVSDNATSLTISRLAFTQSNGLTLSLSTGAGAATVIGSYTVPSTAGLISAINVSASGTSNNLTAITFSNSNNFTFGMSGSTITASYTVPTVTNSSWTVSDNATSLTISRLAFTQSNGMTLSLSTAAGAATVIGSYTVPTVTNSSWTVSDNATSGTVGRLAFTNLNGVTLSLSTGAGGSHTIVGSHNALTSQSNQAASAANGSFAFQTISFSNVNGFSFGTSAGSAITGSYTVPTQSNQTIGGYALGNTTGESSSSTFDARTISFKGLGVVSIGYSNSSILVSAPAAAGDGVNIIAAGTQTAATTGTVVFSNSNGISFGMSNSSVVTASYTVPTQSNQTEGFYALGNTVGESSSSTFDARTLSVKGFGAASVGYSNSSFLISVPAVVAQTNQTIGAYALGNTVGESSSSTFDARTLSFKGLGAASVGYSNTSILISVPTQTNQQMTLFATGNTTQSSTGTTNASSLIFAGSGAASIGLSGNTILVSVPATVAQTNQSLGIYGSSQTVGQSSSSTYDARSLTIVGDGIVSVGWSNSSFRISASTVAQTNQSLGIYGSSQTVGQSSSSTYDARSLTVVGDGIISVGWSNSSFRISATTVAQTNQTIGLYGVGNTVGESSSSTFDARTLSFKGLGIASVGYSNSSVLISVPAGGGAAGTQTIGMSNIGNTSGNTTPVTGSALQIVYAGGNNITLSQSTNGSSATITISAFNQSNQSEGFYALGNTVGESSSSTFDARTHSFKGLGVASVGYSNSSILISAPGANVIAAGSQTAATSGTVVLSNSNGVTFGMSNSSVVTASVGGVYTRSSYKAYDAPLAGQLVNQSTLVVMPYPMPDLQFDRVCFGINFSNASNSSGSHTLSVRIGIYTKNASTLSLLASSSSSLGMTQSGTQGNYSLYNGARNFTIGWTTTISASDYWLGVLPTSASAVANATISSFFHSMGFGGFNGILGVGSNASNQTILGFGYLSVQTGAMPNAIAFTDLIGSTSVASCRPAVYFHSGTV